MSMRINHRLGRYQTQYFEFIFFCNVGESESTCDGGDGELDRVLGINGGAAALSIEGGRQVKKTRS